VSRGSSECYQRLDRQSKESRGNKNEPTEVNPPTLVHWRKLMLILELLENGQACPLVLPGHGKLELKLWPK
jgi:hypothetical protein